MATAWKVPKLARRAVSDTALVPPFLYRPSILFGKKRETRRDHAAAAARTLPKLVRRKLRDWASCFSKCRYPKDDDDDEEGKVTYITASKQLETRNVSWGKKSKSSLLPPEDGRKESLSPGKGRLSESQHPDEDRMEFWLSDEDALDLVRGVDTESSSEGPVFQLKRRRRSTKQKEIHNDDCGRGSQSDRTLQSKSLPGSYSADSDSAKVADTIWRLSSDGVRQLNNVGYNGCATECAVKEPRLNFSASEQSCFTHVASPPWSLADHIQIERDRHKELHWLAERRPVSKFTQKGRLQAMLSSRCWEHYIQAKSVASKVANSEMRSLPLGKTSKQTAGEDAAEAAQVNSISTLQLSEDDGRKGKESSRDGVGAKTTSRHANEIAASSQSNDWSSDEALEEEEEDEVWFSNVCRLRSYWEDLRKQRYMELLDTEIGKHDLRQLLERRTVANILASDMRVKIERLLMSRLRCKFDDEIQEEEEEEDYNEQYWTPSYLPEEEEALLSPPIGFVEYSVFVF